MTSQLVARSISGQFRIPWVAELRDLWVDNQNYQYWSWRKLIDQPLENWALSASTSLVTVSTPLAKKLTSKYHKSVEVILNGFDPSDYPSGSVAQPPAQHLRIVYTGWIYPGKQELSPLFQALQLLGVKANSIRLELYGVDTGWVDKLVSLYNLQGVVETYDRIPYTQALQHQCDADATLFLLWTDPLEKGIYSGKLFEYIGARRPILAIGPADDVAAQLIQERKLGVVLNEPQAIAQQLEQWMVHKQEVGRVPNLGVEVTQGLTRRELAQRLENVLQVAGRC